MPGGKEGPGDVQTGALPAENRVEGVGYVVVPVFNYFFAQRYLYIRVTL